MANNEDKLSRLYREGLGDFVKDPPPQVWSGIKKGLLIRNLITFKFMTSLNIYSVAVFITIAAISGFFAGKELQKKNETVTAARNFTSIVIKTPEKHQISQNLYREQSIELGQVAKQQEISSITNNNFKKQSPIHSKVIPQLIKSIEKPIPVREAIGNSSPQKDNVIKFPDKINDTPLATDNPKKNEFQKHPSENKLIDEKKVITNEQPTKQLGAVNDILIPKKPRTIQGFYAEIFGAPSLLTYKFEQSTVNPNLTFANSSKADEKPALSYTAGLELGYGFKNLFVQTGINYSDYRSKALIDLITTNSVLTTNVTKDSVLVYDSIGSHYEYHYDSIKVSTNSKTHTIHKATNSLRYIEIPILLGYRIYGKRISYAVSGGISIGYLSSSDGKTLNPDLVSISANTTEAVPYKPWTFYLLLRVEAAYLFNKNLSVFIRPGFKYNINSVFEDYYPVQKTFYTLDLHLGIRYNF